MNNYTSSTAVDAVEINIVVCLRTISQVILDNKLFLVITKDNTSLSSKSSSLMCFYNSEYTIILINSTAIKSKVIVNSKSS